MPINDFLGDRMKNYEARNQYWLQTRTPVIIRVDMRAGHTFTKDFQRPFDEVFGNSMVRTMEYCAANIGNCVFAYCQSDEITFVLSDYRKLNTDAWFSYRTDKLCSIAASMATMAFNKFFEQEWQKAWPLDKVSQNPDLVTRYYDASEKGAMFDARCFNIPKEEVANLIYWRQLDATRNSIQMVGQANFSHKELHGKSCNEIQDMLMTQKGINWNDFPTYQKRGSCCVKSTTTVTYATQDEDGNVVTGSAERPRWYIDKNIPIFKTDGREYIDKLVQLECCCSRQAVAMIN